MNMRKSGWGTIGGGAQPVHTFGPRRADHMLTEPTLDWNATSHECVSLASRWHSTAHLRAAGADTPVEVAAATDGYFQGSVEAHETITMTFGVFLDQIVEEYEVMEAADASVHGTSEARHVEGGAPGAETRPVRAALWKRRKSQLHLHLAQCPLSLFPELHKEAAAPECVVDAAAQDVQANLWICLSRGHSALHYDCFDGLLMVLRGTKRVLLLPPSATSALRPRAAHSLSANRSLLSRDELDRTIARLESGGQAWRFEVRAGHTLFIPEGWWHAVDSPDDVTLAVNYWWTPRRRPHAAREYQHVLRRAFEQAAQEETQRVLHELARLEPPSGDEHARAGAVARSCGGWCGAPCERASCTSDADAARLATRLLDAAEGEAGEAGEAGEHDARVLDAPPLLLRLLLEAPAPALCRALAHSAMHEPERLRAWLGRRIGPAAAHALGVRLQEAQGAACAGCGARAARDVESALGVMGDEAAQVAQRETLLSLGRAFVDEAARNVLRGVLGVGELVRDEDEERGGERKRQRC